MLPALLCNLLQTYNPLAIDEDFKPKTTLETWHDKDRNRDVPVKIYLPAKTPAPVVIFSHGLGGSRMNNGYLGEHFAARGYVSVFTQHAGSDESVWKDARPMQRMAAMQKAANGEQLKNRVEDIHFVLDQIESKPNLFDAKHIGMSGHSFGAVTTQAVSGQWYPVVNHSWNDKRIDAAVAYSPSGQRDGAKSFGDVKMPWMLMTGTNDQGPIGGQTPETRLQVFPFLPKGDKYEVNLWEAEHSAFSERALPGDRSKRNPNHHKVILALTTAFWDAYLMENKAAKDWLQGDAPRDVMEEKDTWKTK